MGDIGSFNGKFRNIPSSLATSARASNANELSNHVTQPSISLNKSDRLLFVLLSV